jgi:murein DD-endopeptidase MepM/ murein hydrolase activator NlpD
MITIVVMLFLVGRTGSHDETITPQDSLAAETAVAAVEPEREATPRFAAYQDLDLRLPVDPGDITAVAFHQASGAVALHLVSLVPDADMALAAELKAVPPLEATPTHDPDDPASAVWKGCVLRLWRSNRTGAPDTAVDCGAEPGTPVWSPVSGTVVLIKPYLLYDKYDDYEIHIRPDGRNDVDVVLIHVDDLRVAEGDRVKAGVTRLAAVRQMSNLVDIQLGGYTANGGDHVHVQLNAVQGEALSGANGS